MKSAAVALIVIIITLSSFNKSRTIDEALLPGNWKVIKREILKEDKWNNVLLKECDKDDRMVLASDGSLKVDLGLLHCKEREKNVEGTWKMADEAKLDFTINGLKTTQTVTAVTKDALVLQFSGWGNTVSRTTFSNMGK